MLEIMESLIPANINSTTALLIIVLCAFIDILSPGVLAITAYILLIRVFCIIPFQRRSDSIFTVVKG